MSVPPSTRGREEGFCTPTSSPRIKGGDPIMHVNVEDISTSTCTSTTDEVMMTQQFCAAAAQLAEDKQEAQQLLERLTETPSYQRKLHAWRAKEAHIQRQEAALEEVWDQLILDQQKLDNSSHGSPTNTSSHTQQLLQQLLLLQKTQQQQQQQQQSLSPLSSQFSSPSNHSRKSVPRELAVTLEEQDEEEDDISTYSATHPSTGEPTESYTSMNTTSDSMIRQTETCNENHEKNEHDWSGEEGATPQAIERTRMPEFGSNPNTPAKPHHYPALQVVESSKVPVPPWASPSEARALFETDVDVGGSWDPYNPNHRHAHEESSDDEDYLEVQRLAAEHRLPHHPLAATHLSHSKTKKSQSDSYDVKYHQEMLQLAEQILQQDQASMDQRRIDESDTDDDNDNDDDMHAIQKEKDEPQNNDGTTDMAMSTPLRQETVQVDAAVEVARQMAEAAASWNSNSNVSTASSSSSPDKSYSSNRSASSYLIPSPPKQRRVHSSSMADSQQQQLSQQQPHYLNPHYCADDPEDPDGHATETALSESSSVVSVSKIMAASSHATIQTANTTTRKKEKTTDPESEDRLCPTAVASSDSSVFSVVSMTAASHATIKTKNTTRKKEANQMVVQDSISLTALQESARVDAAVEATRQMAQALKDTTSSSSTPMSHTSSNSHDSEVPFQRSMTATTPSSLRKSSRKIPPPPPPPLSFEQEPVKDVYYNSTPKRSLQRTIPHISPLVTSPGSSSSRTTKDMLLLLHAGKEAPSVEYEPICSAEEEDDDYVPLVDYTLLNTTTTTARMDLPEEERVSVNDCGPSPKRPLQRTIPHLSPLVTSHGSSSRGNTKDRLLLKPVGNTLYAPICSAQEEDDDYVPLVDYSSKNTTTTTTTTTRMGQEDWETYRVDAPIHHRAAAFSLQQRRNYNRRRRRIIFGGLFLLLATIFAAMMYHRNSSNKAIMGGPSIDNDHPTSLVGTPFTTTVTIDPTTNNDTSKMVHSNHHEEEEDIGTTKSMTHLTVIDHSLSIQPPIEKTFKEKGGSVMTTIKRMAESNSTVTPNALAIILQKDNLSTDQRRPRPRRCFIPFTHLISRRCRIMAKEHPLFNVQALTDCMFE